MLCLLRILCMICIIGIVGSVISMVLSTAEYIKADPDEYNNLGKRVERSENCFYVFATVGFVLIVVLSFINM